MIRIGSEVYFWGPSRLWSMSNAWVFAGLGAGGGGGVAASGDGGIGGGVAPGSGGITGAGVVAGGIGGIDGVGAAEAPGTPTMAVAAAPALAWEAATPTP